MTTGFLCGVFLMLVFVLSESCKSSPEIQLESLYGTWDVIRADRNGKETPYLRGGYFKIEQNGTMTLNITGEDEKGPFILHNRTLTVNESKNFYIASMQSDSMTLRFIMNPESEFLFYLHKNKNETQ